MANTINRGYPMPVDTKSVREEIENLQQSVLPMLDNDIHAVFVAIGNLAPIEHGHDIAEVTGLTEALAGKMPAGTTFALSDLTNVVGSAEAPDGYVLVKVGDDFVAQSALTAIGEGTVLQRVNNLGDLLNVATARNNLKAVGYEVATVTDADALFQPGNYMAGTTWAGSPIAGASANNQGYLGVQRLGDPANVLQVFTASTGVQQVLMRRRIASAWEAWRPMMVGTNTISSAAPSGGVDGDIWYQV